VRSVLVDPAGTPRQGPPGARDARERTHHRGLSNLQLLALLDIGPTPDDPEPGANSFQWRRRFSRRPGGPPDTETGPRCRCRLCRPPRVALHQIRSRASRRTGTVLRITSRQLSSCNPSALVQPSHPFPGNASLPLLKPTLSKKNSLDLYETRI
jgi:hypothetical protein